jgi:hypothetical protein
LSLVNREHLKDIRENIEPELFSESIKLKPIKDLLDDAGFGDVSYFEIKAYIAIKDLV